MNLIYSRTKVPGAAYRPDIRVMNPRFFTEANPDAKAVYLNGDFPDIKAAYEAAKVPVHDFSGNAGTIPTPEEPKPKSK